MVSVLSLDVISLVLLSLESGVFLESSDVLSVFFFSIFREIILMAISIEENDEVFFFFIRFDGSTGGFLGTVRVGGSDGVRHVHEGFSGLGRVGSTDGFVAAVGSAD